MVGDTDDAGVGETWSHDMVGETTLDDMYRDIVGDADTSSTGNTHGDNSTWDTGDAAGDTTAGDTERGEQCAHGSRKSTLDTDSDTSAPAGDAVLVGLHTGSSAPPDVDVTSAATAAAAALAAATAEAAASSLRAPGACGSSSTALETAAAADAAADAAAVTAADMTVERVVVVVEEHVVRR